MEPSQKSLESIIDIIVNTVHPVKIILFGSAARDSFHEYSDLDFLIIMPDGINQWDTLKQLYWASKDAQYPIDFVVASESVIQEQFEDKSMVYYPALKEGKELYARVS